MQAQKIKHKLFSSRKTKAERYRTAHAERRGNQNTVLGASEGSVFSRYSSGSNPLIPFDTGKYTGTNGTNLLDSATNRPSPLAY